MQQDLLLHHEAWPPHSPFGRKLYLVQLVHVGSRHPEMVKRVKGSVQKLVAKSGR